ncbi:uncharacterized protein LOC18028260 [Eutrema salsugineum]|nr:uncharacterized protein LOC18028260 [Eutrema salsugineum]
MVTEEEINEISEDSGYLSSGEEGEIRELVCALPALNVTERLNMEEAGLHNAVVAAEFVMVASEEAPVSKENMQTVDAIDDDAKNTALGRRPRIDELDDAAGASGSTAIGSGGEDEPVKKAKKKGSSQLHAPPQGPPQCNICGRNFTSWKAVFGHLRAHKDRGYQGFLPPPTFNATEEGFSAVVLASDSSRGGVLGFGSSGIDLNLDPMEEEEEAVSGFIPKFDLNRSPPQEGQEEEEEDKAK